MDTFLSGIVSSGPPKIQEQLFKSLSLQHVTYIADARLGWQQWQTAKVITCRLTTSEFIPHSIYERPVSSGAHAQPTEALIQNDVLTSCTEQMCVTSAIQGSIHVHSPFTPCAKQRYVHAESFMEWARNLMTSISLFCSVTGNNALYKSVSFSKIELLVSYSLIKNSCP